MWVRVGDSARLACGGAALGWQRPEFDDRSWGVLVGAVACGQRRARRQAGRGAQVGTPWRIATYSRWGPRRRLGRVVVASSTCSRVDGPFGEVPVKLSRLAARRRARGGPV